MKYLEITDITDPERIRIKVFGTTKGLKNYVIQNADKRKVGYRFRDVYQIPKNAEFMLQGERL